MEKEEVKITQGNVDAAIKEVDELVVRSYCSEAIKKRREPNMAKIPSNWEELLEKDFKKGFFKWYNSAASTETSKKRSPEDMAKGICTATSPCVRLYRGTKFCSDGDACTCRFYLKRREV